MKKLVLLLLWAFLSAEVQCQTITASLVDSITSLPVTYAHVSLVRGGLGTISNEQGEFQLPQPAGPDTLLISHIAYQTRRIPLAALAGGTTQPLYLNPEVTVLSEVVVSELVATSLLEDVITSLKNSPPQFAKAFYRQITYRDQAAKEWIEAFYEAQYTANGIDAIRIDQARFARMRYDTANIFVAHSNFSALSLTSSIYSPATGITEGKVAKPFSLDFIDQYHLTLEKRYIQDSDTCLLINYRPKASIANAITAFGNFIYNQSAKHLVQFTAVVDHALGSDNLEGYRGSKKIAMRNPQFILQYNYSPLAGTLEYITVDFTCDFVQNDVVHPSRVSSKFVIYQKLKAQPKGLRPPSLELEDVANFEKAKYKPKFWRDNPIIKRSPQEEAIIAGFEQENAFGTYFKK